MTTYNTNLSHYCIDYYKYPTAIQGWNECPHCKLKPKVWIFDNGKFTACGCWNDKHDRFSIQAESINSFLKRKGSTTNYDSDNLRKNWNHWAETGEIIFDRGREEHKW